VIEYWSGTTLKFPSEAVAFRFKLDTDLYALAKAKTTACSLEASRDGAQFSIIAADRHVPNHISAPRHLQFGFSTLISSPEAAWDKMLLSVTDTYCKTCSYQSYHWPAV